MRSEQATRAVIIAAAARAFLAGGYAKTGVDVVARLAGVSTRTIYRLFSTKEGLLKQAMAARIDESFGLLQHPGVDTGDHRVCLTTLLSSYADLVLSEDAMLMTRLIAAERLEVPSLVDNYRQATARVTGLFDAWIAAEQAAGRLKAMETTTLSHLLRGMINEAQRQMLLGLREPLDAAARRAWVEACATVFLNGCEVAHPGQLARD